MAHCLKLFVCLTATLTGAALAQTTDQPESTKTASPVAYVYVSGQTSILAFAASSNGKLTPVPGSPFPGSLSHMSVNKTYLFGAGDNGKDIYTFAIASNGALHQVSETNAQKYNPYGCGSIGPTQIDYSGATLYNQVNAGDCEDVQFIQAFKIENNGELQFIGNAISGIPTDIASLAPVRFLGTNKFAYQTGCADDSGLIGPVNEVYKRESNGTLTTIAYENLSPKPENPDDVYCPFLLAGDPTNHLAVAYSLYNANGFVGTKALASYTADSHGNLTTTNTFENMPPISSETTAMSISPTGELLAVGGVGFHVFHFNGSSPITPDGKGFLNNYEFLEFGWDGNNHLYALAVDALFVFTVTPTTITEAPGSPYTIPLASSLIVRAVP
jgi:hypothetical protein